MFLIPGGPYALGSDAEVGGFLVCVMDERLRAFTGCLNCSSCDLCDGLQLGPRRRWRALSTVFVRCTRVVRTLTWWDELDVSSRVKSGYVGLCRVMSGKNFFPALFAVRVLHQFFRFRSLFPVLASSLRCSSTTLTDDRHMPVCWRWGQGVGSGRVGSVYVGSERADFLFLGFIDWLRARFLTVLVG